MPVLWQSDRRIGCREQAEESVRHRKEQKRESFAATAPSLGLNLALLYLVNKIVKQTSAVKILDANSTSHSYAK